MQDTLAGLTALLVSAVLLLAGLNPVGAPAFGVPAGPWAAADGWKADPADNICGLRDVRQLSDPAKVDYEELLEATPEIKKMKEDGIDPESPKGIQLRTQAADRITRTCNTVREDEGHCSVWKKISHSDGRSVADITAEVKAEFPDDDAGPRAAGHRS